MSYRCKCDRCGCFVYVNIAYQMKQIYCGCMSTHTSNMIADIQHSVNCKMDLFVCICKDVNVTIVDAL
mgnify:CR=1 FL=1